MGVSYRIVVCPGVGPSRYSCWPAAAIRDGREIYRVSVCELLADVFTATLGEPTQSWGRAADHRGCGRGAVPRATVHYGTFNYGTLFMTNSCSAMSQLSRRPIRGRGMRLLAAIGFAGLSAGACAGTTEPEERVRTYEVAEARVDCNGVGGPSLCLSVRTPPDTVWRILYGVVEGFDHEVGYRYVLELAERHISNPPADGPSIGYRMIRVISRTAVAP